MVIHRFLTVAVLSVAGFLGSCVTNSASIYIAGAIAVEKTDCTYDVSAARLASTLVDPAIPRAVTVGFVVENLIQKRNFNVETDVSTALITSAEISLTDASGAALPGGSFLVDVPGGVVPGSTDGISPGQGVVFIEVVPAAVVAMFAGNAVDRNIIANVTLRGRTLGHIDLEGGPFPWVVTILPEFTYRETACVVGSTRSCCSAGMNGERYCSNISAACTNEN